MPSSSALVAFFLNVFIFEFSSACYPTNNYYFPENKPAFAAAVIEGIYENHNISGLVRFRQETVSSPLEVFLNISGLPSSASILRHGLHVHTNAITVVSNDGHHSRCGSAGPHFNPTNTTHGDINDAVRHVGDYGNVGSDTNGLIIYQFNDTISQLYGPFGIIGRTLILHINEDDLGQHQNFGSISSGNSGPRVACGVIGIVEGLNQ